MTNPIPIAPDIDEAALRRFWAKVALPDANGCLLWTAGKNRHGYGKIKRADRHVYAHRFAYSVLVGPIPDGLPLDHLCRNRACVAPDHLEPVTQAENVRRGNSGAANAAKTHCPQGHPYSGENTYVNPDGKRVCRTCLNARRRAAFATRKAVSA